MLPMRQTKQYYTYKINGEESLHNFDLACMNSPDNEQKFVPVYICDLLGLTVSGPVTEEKEGVTYYVKETDPAKATVRVGQEYYRKAEEADSDAPKYNISISEASKTEARSEGYYLTVQVPATEGVGVVNNRLNCASFSRKAETLPAVIRSDSKISGSTYVIYDGIQQTFEISTNRVHNENNMDDTVMENGDSIKIKLKSELKLTKAGIGRFDTVGPAEIYHQFDINLKEYLKNKTEYGIIGTEMVEYQYTISGNGLNWTWKVL